MLAGADIVLVCHDHEKQVEVLEALKEAVLEGVIAQEVLDEHLYRILYLKEKYRLSHEIMEPVNIQEINAKITAVLEAYL